MTGARCLFCGGDASEPGHLAQCDGKQGRAEAEFFSPNWTDEPDTTGMVHRGDPSTSFEAAAVIARKRTELHERVLDAFRARGRMTDEDLEQLPQFQAFGPSTIRKRRSELFQQGALVVVSFCVNSRGRKMLVWALPS